MSQLRKYQKLREQFNARTLVPIGGPNSTMSRRLIASYQQMDQIEKYYHFRALMDLKQDEMGVQEAYITHVRVTRELAHVNARARNLWAPFIKPFSFKSFLSEYLVTP